MCRTVHRVSGLIAENFSGVISWPTAQRDLERIKADFYNMAGLPDVIGRFLAH